MPSPGTLALRGDSFPAFLFVEVDVKETAFDKPKDSIMLGGRDFLSIIPAVDYPGKAKKSAPPILTHFIAPRVVSGQHLMRSTPIPTSSPLSSEQDGTSKKATSAPSSKKGKTSEKTDP